MNGTNNIVPPYKCYTHFIKIYFVPILSQKVPILFKMRIQVLA